MTEAVSPYQLRLAGPSDNDALIALDLRSPIVAGEFEVSFDRSPDYFAPARMQDQTRYAIAEIGGEIVGVCANALHTATLLGKERLLAYTHHERIDPTHQRRGIGGDLPAWLRENWTAEGLTPDGSYAYIDSANAGSLAFASRRGGPGPWPVDAWLQELPPSDHAPTRDEHLTEADIPELVTLLNETHGELELRPCYTTRTLTMRLERSPEYGIRSFRAIHAGGRIVAAIGTHDVGAQLSVIVLDRTSGQRTENRALEVLDYGFRPGYERAMLELIAGAQALAAQAGRQSLEMGVPECSPIFNQLMGAARSHIRFKFLGGDPRPETSYPLRGVYLDPAYL